ncbi:MAG: TlyA family RNA methyltransferase [Chthoniobacterales bacterium]|nr:TlyA family RNA methyltransferase [Chthoniobacterales bacterium]
MSASLPRLRLDQLLHEKGFFPSREKAQRAILAGQVLVEGQVQSKPGSQVPITSTLTVRERDRYVSRGGHKLEGALKGFAINPTGLECLDLGSSTGGFTDCLLQHGAAHVTGIDVGKGQLAWSLRQDPRVTIREGVNARYLQPSDFEKRFDLIVGDLSFISLTQILPAAFSLVKPEGSIVALIKPQFELSKKEVGRGGIVRDPLLHQKAIDSIRHWVSNAGYYFENVIPSPLPGMTGNIEFLALLRLPTPSLLDKLKTT